MEFLANIRNKILNLFAKDTMKVVVRRFSDLSGLDEKLFSITDDIPVKGIRIAIEKDEDRHREYLVLTPGDGVKFADELHFCINKLEKHINEAAYGSSGYAGSLSSGARVRYDLDDNLKEFIKFKE